MSATLLLTSRRAVDLCRVGSCLCPWRHTADCRSHRRW